MLVLMVGLPGTGKSTLSRALVERFGGFVIDKDVIRPALFGPSQIEYSVEQDDFCQNVMLETAEYLLQRKAKLRVFLDGRPFSREYQRRSVLTLSEKIRTPLAVIECVASESTALARIREDLEAGVHLAANRTPELYVTKKQDFEREPLSGPRLTISSDQPLEASILQAERYLASIEPPADC
ncbi:MAG TPA: ATP-binding protein [Terriglobales bacterium]|jgi:predicted kinase|nr:ATP-binding protein [Terriglobales bacterium]